MSCVVVSTGAVVDDVNCASLAADAKPAGVMTRCRLVVVCSVAFGLALSDGECTIGCVLVSVSCGSVPVLQQRPVHVVRVLHLSVVGLQQQQLWRPHSHSAVCGHQLDGRVRCGQRVLRGCAIDGASDQRAVQLVCVLRHDAVLGKRRVQRSDKRVRVWIRVQWRLLREERGVRRSDGLTGCVLWRGCSAGHEQHVLCGCAGWLRRVLQQQYGGEQVWRVQRPCSGGGVAYGTVLYERCDGREWFVLCQRCGGLVR